MGLNEVKAGGGGGGGGGAEEESAGYQASNADYSE